MGTRGPVAAHGFRATPHLPKLAALEGRLAALPPEARARIASATAKIATLDKLQTLCATPADFPAD